MGSEQYGPARAEVSITIESGIATFEISGTATRQSVLIALQDAYAIDDKPIVYAAIAQYDRADAAVSMSDLMAIYADVQQSGLPANIPTALVVSPASLPAARDYCRLQGAGGVMRAAFLDRDEARQWAERQAGLFRLERRSRNTDL
jgi:hypothetical protein